MLDVANLSEELKIRSSSLETKLHRISALAKAIADLSDVLPASLSETAPLQALVGLLEETAPAALEDVQWCIEASAVRSHQLDSMSLKSVA